MLIDKLKELTTRPSDQEVTQQEIDEMYDKYLEFDKVNLQALIGNHEEEKKTKSPGSWTWTGLIKKLFGVIMAFALLKQILFPE